MDVNQLTPPLSFMKEQISQKGVSLGCRFDCEYCLVQPEGCQLLKDVVQDLTTKGALQFDRTVDKTKIDEDGIYVITIPVKAKTIQVPVKISVPVRKSPIIIIVLGPIPYTSNKAVPWHYGG